MLPPAMLPVLGSSSVMVTVGATLSNTKVPDTAAPAWRLPAASRVVTSYLIVALSAAAARPLMGSVVQ